MPNLGEKDNSLHSINNAFVSYSETLGISMPPENGTPDFEQFGTLYKHCKHAHLPKVGGSLRLGTLSEYRRAENQAIRDEHEGTFKISLAFPEETTISVEALRRATLDTSPVSLGISMNNVRTNVFSGQLTEGCVFSVDNVSVASRNEKEIKLSGSVTIHAEGADAYVLCLSTANKVGSIILDPEYQSVWAIKPGFVFNFVSEIIKVLTPILAPGFSVPRGKFRKMHFYLSAEIWPVIYRNRTIVFASDISERDIREVYSCIDRSASIKPPDFAHENEVRIIFRPCFFDPKTNRRFLSPRLLEPVLIPFDSVLDMVDIECP